MAREFGVIHGLYHGKIAPWEKPPSHVEAYRKRLRKLDGLETQLRTLLGAEHMPVLAAYIEANEEVYCDLEEEKFRDGFLLGATLMMEICQGE